MSGCEALVAQGAGGVAAALRAVDCMTAETAAGAFARLFGAHGALLPALTLALTLYVGFFAVGLLTGRARLGLSALTPRMMTLGLVLTFATSWLAWQGVVWNLAAGAPDEIAAALTGLEGPATRIFADRIDIVFAAVAETAANTGAPTAPAAQPAFGPGTLLWLAALLLLLGTAGVLVTAKIVLGALMAVGPVFVVLALFAGTRGLFAGWLRAMALTALAPVIVVLGGMVVLELMAPLLAAMRAGEEVDGRAAIALFTLACVHMALVALAMRVAQALVGGWDVFGLAPVGAAARGAAAAVPAAFAMPGAGAAAPAAEARRTAGVVAGLAAMPPVTVEGAAPASATSRTTVVIPSAPLSAEFRHARRAQGIGSRFRAPAPARALREISR